MNFEELKIYRDYKIQLNPDVELTGNTPRRSTAEDLLNHYSNILIDGFGTLYRHDQVYPDAIEFLAKCRERQKEIRLVTNTASQDARSLAHQLQEKGLEIHPHEVISSGALLPDLMKTPAMANFRQCFHLGKDSALPLLSAAGLVPTEDPEQPVVVLSSFFSNPKKMDELMEKAKEILRRPKALLILMNPDAYAPRSETEKIPVSGYYARILVKNTRCRLIVLGKPFPLIFTKALHTLVPYLAASVMIGDTVGTDILGAAHSGISTALLLRGNTIEEEMREDFYQLGVNPTYILESLQTGP